MTLREFVSCMSIGGLMLGMSEELKVAASVLVRERELAHKRGYAEGLEAAANIVQAEFAKINNGDVDYTEHRSLAQILRDESKRVREIGVSK